MQSFDPFTIAILVAAIVVILKLRAILGQKTGHDEDISDMFDPDRHKKQSHKPKEDGPSADNVVKLPTRVQNDNVDTEEKDPRLGHIDKIAKPRTKINKGLKEILAADNGFNPKEFMAGADMAYEMIVNAFAQGDTKSLSNLLSKEVFEGFKSVIDDRESRGESVKSTFIGIDESQVHSAAVKSYEAHITIKFISQIVSATLDKDGVVIEGDDKDIARVKDIWTFARDTRSNDPNWKLVATEAGA